MNIAEIVHNFGEMIGSTASVRSVYGEPVKVGDRVVLPVARIRYAFGGGGGQGRDPETSKHGGGGGGGGRVAAEPTGLVEVTPEGARFIYYREPAWIAAIAAAGFFAGLAVSALTRNCRSKSV